MNLNSDIDATLFSIEAERRLFDCRLSIISSEMNTLMKTNKETSMNTNDGSDELKASHLPFVLQKQMRLEHAAGAVRDQIRRLCDKETAALKLHREWVMHKDAIEAQRDADIAAQQRRTWIQILFMIII